jgi:hypothetical protein
MMGKLLFLLDSESNHERRVKNKKNIAVCDSKITLKDS